MNEINPAQNSEITNMYKENHEALDACIDEIVGKIRAAAKNNLPESGRFEEISFLVDNPEKFIYADKFFLRITQPKERQREIVSNFDAKRYLEAMVDSPKGTVSRIMIGGTSNEIMPFLENPQINQQVLDAFKELASCARHW
jgi:hypothetical protein